jgi:hypothetical protein
VGRKPPQLVEESTQTDAEQISGLPAVAVRCLQGTLNGLPLDGLDLRLEIERPVGHAVVSHACAVRQREVFGVERSASPEHGSALD